MGGILALFKLVTPNLLISLNPRTLKIYVYTIYKTWLDTVAIMSGLLSLKYKIRFLQNIRLASELEKYYESNNAYIQNGNNIASFSFNLMVALKISINTKFWF